MTDLPLAPYLYWAKTRPSAPIDLAGSNLQSCTLDDLPGAREAVDVAARNDNGYGPLIDAIARHYGIDSARIATATGCSGANFLVIATLLTRGDHVLVERPTYDPILGACRFVGADIEHFDRRFEDGYQVDVSHVARRMRSRTRLIVVTTPHNPTGVSLTAGTLAELGALATRAGATVLVDEVYGDAASLIQNEAATMQSAASIDGPFVITNSLTKSYGLAGLRCGWAIASAAVAERIRRTRDVVDNAGPVPSDLLATHAFSLLPTLAQRTKATLGPNVDRARDFFAGHPQLELAQLPRASVTFPRLAGVADAGPFVQHVFDRHGVALAPGAFFDAPAHFRISLAGTPETLARGLERLALALNEHG